MFNLYEWEYKSVIENSINPARLRKAWERRIFSTTQAARLIRILNHGEGLKVILLKHDARSSFAYQDEDERLTITLGQDISAGLILHEYAHCMLFKVANENHGPLFTITLDMLLWKYERYWL